MKNSRLPLNSLYSPGCPQTMILNYHAQLIPYFGFHLKWLCLLKQTQIETCTFIFTPLPTSFLSGDTREHFCKCTLNYMCFGFGGSHPKANCILWHPDASEQRSQPSSSWLQTPPWDGQMWLVVVSIFFKYSSCCGIHKFSHTHANLLHAVLPWTSVCYRPPCLIRSQTQWYRKPLTGGLCILF